MLDRNMAKFVNFWLGSCEDNVRKLLGKLGADVCK